jgi:hypothetical protein
MLRVLTPPEPIVTPENVPGDHAGNDAYVKSVIAAVTQSIEGPTGWLNRALGEHTLELVLCEFPHKVTLPCRPIIEIEEITYLDAYGDAQVLDDGVYRHFGEALYHVAGRSLPSHLHSPDAVRIRYRAGYNGTPVADGGTGEVPDSAKHAIILSAQHMLSLGAENLFLASEEVEGVGTTRYTVSDQAANLIATTCDRLLQGLRVYA